jgi:hypothetical protein
MVELALDVGNLISWTSAVENIERLVRVVRAHSNRGAGRRLYGV